MKILHINSYYSVSDFYKNLYNEQKKNGIDIDVYVPVSTSLNTKKLNLGEYTNISINHGKYDRLFFHVKHSKIYNDITNIYEIKNYSMIHAHSLFSNGYIAYKLKQQYNIPYIVAVRNTDINLFFKKIIYLRNLGLNILKNAKKIIFISNPYKEYTIDKFIPKKFKKEIKEKSIVIPNGIDEFWLKNKYNKQTIIDDRKIKLIYVGKIDSNKNIETTIRACEVLIEEGYEVSYKIIGRISDNRYYNLINSYSFIEYIPYCEKEELIYHYRNADIFIMPSKYETFGLVYAEAMSQGLPVIYTRGQGFDGKFREGEIGYPVIYNSVEQIVDSIKDIMFDYSLISENCIQNINNFSWKNITIKYMDIYKY